MEVGVRLGKKQLTFRSAEFEGTTGHLIETILQGIRNTGTRVEISQSKKYKLGSHSGGNWGKMSVFLESLLRKENKGAGSQREGDSFLAVLESGCQEQITKLSNSSIALNIV